MEQAAKIASSSPTDHGAAAPRASLVDVRCPECGHPASKMERVLANPWHWSRAWPRIVGVVCLIGLLVWQMFTPTTTGMTLGTPYAQFALNGYSSERVAEIGSGASVASAGEFSRSVLRVVGAPSERFLPGRTGVRVAFFDAPSQRSEYVGFGWPAKFLSVGRRGVFENALTRSGFQASKTDIKLPRMGHWEVSGQLPRAAPRDLWYFGANQLVIRPAPESTGGWDTQVYLDVGSLAVNVAVFGGVVWMGAWAFRSWRRKRGMEEERSRWGSRVIPLGGMALLLMIAMGVLLGTSRVTVLPPYRPLRQVNLPSGQVYFASDGLALLDIDVDELRRIAGTAAGDVRLAKEIMRTVQPGAGTTGYLAIAPLPEFVWDSTGTKTTTFGAAIPFFRTYDVAAFRHPEFTLPSVSPSSRMNVSFISEELSILPSGVRGVNATGDVMFSKYGIRWTSLGMCLVFALVPWALFRGSAWMWCWWRYHRWGNAGRCMICGYSLERLPPLSTRA